MTVQELVNAMEQIAPTRYAEAWDNVGLLVGDARARVSRVLLCIDLTMPVLEEAVGKACDAVVAYHPLIFEGLKKVVAGGAGGIAFEAARRGIAVYSPHTALDVAAGGTNDVLCDLLAITNPVALKPFTPKDHAHKLVTFIPPDAVERVSHALFAAGAGSIGAYSNCSFRSEGTGTFLGDATTNPAVGQKGTLTVAPEVRFETILPSTRIVQVIAALKATHPYEEPAVDLIPLTPLPEPPNIGIGRVGQVNDTTLAQVVERLKHACALDSVLVVGDPAKPITRIAVCAGAGRSLVGDVFRARADLFVTGELPHHDALRLAAAGVAVICTLHSNSERPTLPVLARKLAGFECFISEHDRDPFRIA